MVSVRVVKRCIRSRRRAYSCAIDCRSLCIVVRRESSGGAAARVTQLGSRRGRRYCRALKVWIICTLGGGDCGISDDLCDTSGVATAIFLGGARCTKLQNLMNAGLGGLAVVDARGPAEVTGSLRRRD